ncbi:MAG: hypothetical protein IJO91_08280 [Oscillospiraceae bacterium]|nr:hypothetical protein [Oscillospiraceae bacterium]
MDKQKLALIGLILAVVAFLFNIIGIFVFFISFLAPLVAIAAIVLGGMGLKNIDGTTSGLGIAALIGGIVMLLFSIPVFICGVCQCSIICAAAEMNASGLSSSDIESIFKDLY